MSDRTAALDERARIKAYAAGVPETHALQESWIQALRDARLVESPEALGGALNLQVLPRLQKYYDTLAVMDTATPELTRIHAVMLVAHGALIDSYSAFAHELTARNYKERRAQLVPGIEAFHASQDRYRVALNAYYDERGIELELAEPIRL